MVFFRIAGCVWVRRGRRSGRTDKARDGVMTCGRVMIGRGMTVVDAETRSFIYTVSKSTT